VELKKIIDLLLKLFPAVSFLEYLPLFKEAIEKPETLKNVIIQFETKSGMGVVSYIAIVARELLNLENFYMFTRDYIKQCGDLVELFVKVHLVNRLPLCKLNKSLGANVRIMQKQYGAIIPKELLGALHSFDGLIQTR
jgi:hypothetical protein